MSSFTLASLPAALSWINAPLDFAARPDGALTIAAGEKTDWFIDPNGAFTAGSAPAALFEPGDPFILSASLAVDFGSTFDAGVLFLHARDDLWAKLCFEFSPQRRPMVVSVVTRGLSDDCNAAVIDKNEVCLRISRDGPTFAFHYSLDGKWWNMVRYFTLGDVSGLRVGFEAQSPTGPGCRVVFSEIHYQAARLPDLRSGE